MIGISESACSEVALDWIENVLMMGLNLGLERWTSIYQLLSRFYLEPREREAESISENKPSPYNRTGITAPHYHYLPELGVT